jgi:hypothetical protein
MSHFWFPQCVIEFFSDTSEGIFVSHHPFQYENHWIDCVRSFSFHNQKDNGWNVEPIKNKYHQVIG